MNQDNAAPPAMPSGRWPYVPRLPKFLGQPDEDAFGAAEVAEAIGVLVLDHLADRLGAAFAEPGERIVDNPRR